MAPVTTKANALNAPKYLLADEPPSIQSLVEGAKSIHEQTFSQKISPPTPDEKKENPAAIVPVPICTVAPGRVNLIGEHTDYTGGFVFPMAIGYSTVCFGIGSIIPKSEADSQCQVISVNKNSEINESSPAKVITFTASESMEPMPMSSEDSWSNYVAGVVKEYMKELPSDVALQMQIAISGNVPLGSGLSSSAALEVAVATFIEAVIERWSASRKSESMEWSEKGKALRCQKAENEFCSSPCGIMDQYVSSAAAEGSAIFIDCRSLDYTSVKMGHSAEKDKTEKPVFLICNSNVKHSIGGGEYPVRVKQCAEATSVLQSIFGTDKIRSLRDATVADIEIAREATSEDNPDHPLMDNLIYRRAKHVVSENERTQEAKNALVEGNWVAFGNLMNQSHESMKLDYEVSCDEIDFLAALAQGFEGVYGSRLTGGGFGGCTVTLVERSRVEALSDFLRNEYRAKWGKDCLCFETSPGPGARELVLE